MKEAVLNAHEVIEAAKEHLDFLSALSMPTIHEYSWPPLYQGIWDWFRKLASASRESGCSVDELFEKVALGLPRGFAKSTFIRLYVLYIILFTDRKFIIIFCATATHARNALSDIADMLDESNIKKVFGDWRVGMEQDTQDVKKFGFRGRNVVLAGIGAGGAVRGLLTKGDRPDVMIFDDVQTKEDSESKVVSDSLYTWLIGTAMKAKSPKRCLTLFIANMYPTENSILRKLKANPEWTKFIAGGILSDGTSLWEDLQPIEQLLAEYRNDVAAGKPEIFHAEVLNDEFAAVNNLLDFSSIPEFPAAEGDIHLGSYIIIDPSNDKHNSDSVAIGYFEVHGNQIPCLMQLVEERLSPGDTIKKALQLAIDNSCSLIAIESNAYQYSLLYWFNLFCQQLGLVGINVVPIYSGSRSKNSRILDFFKAYMAGEISVHPKVKAILEAQMRSFNPMKTDNIDNTLDLMTYSPRVLTEFADQLKNYTVVGAQEWQEDSNKASLFSDETICSSF
ncbi:hypothetical protein [Candidatus Macondimonas diazotrophica]|uniref:Terminase large subunit gp17-like C-terminal domain-containing protein n=1 Tax=Candidatus Macondimonas diazotrophica TaxID=2305248 RepID=A0A4Z0F882_9GAMM|nr:hypothetical protein [Candidatus Macondimonas diazotrophica]TFZ81692.1 hypothetical protein E4680_11520 [Candidatus Macondimonas diazotrophica]